MKTMKIAVIAMMGMSLGIKAQNEAINGNLTVRGSLSSQGSSHTFSTESGKTNFRLTFNMLDAENAYLYNYNDTAQTFHTINVGGSHSLASGLTILGNGNVGIGTSSPTVKLDLSSNSFGLPATSGSTPNGFLRIGYIQRSWGGTEILSGIINNSTQDYAGYIQAKNPIDYSHNRTFLINPQGGNVGIGTTSPKAKLNVVSNENKNSTKVLVLRATGTGSESNMNYNRTKQSLGIGFNRLWGSNETNLAGIYSYGSVGWRGGLVFKTKNSTTSTGEADIEAMVIRPDGNVGIGTTSPSDKLSLEGDSSTKLRIQNNSSTKDLGIWLRGKRSGSNVYSSHYIGTQGESHYNLKINADEGLKLQTNSQDRLTILGNGKVGVGTISPDMRLSVLSDDEKIARFHYSGSSAVSGFRVGRSVSYGDFINLTNGFGIGAGTSSGNLPLSTQSKDHIDFFINNATRNIGIGTTRPDMKLTVKGNIHAEEVKIDLNVPAPDYVFKSDYKLMSIEEVESFIKVNSHLPEIPSAKEFAENGVMQAEMDMNLLKKIEELTLYTIEQEKKIKKLEKRNSKIDKQQKEIEELKKQNSEIKELKALVQKLLKNKN